MISLDFLLNCIGDIDEIFLEEAETADISQIRRAKRRRAAKYGALGLAISVGVAGAAMAFWKFRGARRAAA